MKTTFNTDKESGLTLIELIVAIGLFGLLSVFVTGAFMNIMSVKAQAEEKQQIMNDFRVALDLMGREIRSGRAFPQAEEGVSRISFMSRVRTDLPWKFTQYELQNGRIMKGQRDTQGFCNLRTEYDEEGRAYGAFDPDCLFPFTSDRVNVRDLTFYIHNFDPDEHYGFPLITIAVKGEVLVGDTRHSFKTSVSYSPRQALNPEFRIPTDTTPPRVDIRMVDGYLLGDGDRQGGVKFKQVDTGIVSLSGRAWDPGGSGIKKVILTHSGLNYSRTLNFPGCDPDEDYSTNVNFSFDPSVEWLEGGWSNRFNINSNRNLVLYENSNLYLDLSMAPSGFWEKVRSDGGDIRVTQGDGTTLVAREVSGFDRSNRKGSLFFNTEGYLSTTEDTEWYIYYGNPGATEPNPGDPIGRNNVWDDNYVGVWHLDEDRSDLLGTTETESLFITAMMSRGDSGSASWSNDVGGNYYHYDGSGVTINSGYGLQEEDVEKESTGSWSTAQNVLAGLIVFSAEGATGFSRVQQAVYPDRSHTASATFSQTPTEGNLLVAISAHRTDGHTPSISGSGWNLALNECYAIAGGACGPYSSSYRRGMAVWWKVAGESEPTTVETTWDPTTENTLLIQEFEITGNTSFSFDTSSHNHSAENEVNSLSIWGIITVKDSTSNNNHGTLFGPGSGVSGKLTNAIEFDGVENVIRIPDSPSTSIEGDQFTLSAWVNPTNIEGDRDFGVISKAHEHSVSTNIERYHLGVSRVGGVVVRRRSGDETAIFSTSEDQVTENSWQYLTGRYDGSYLRAFIDGSLLPGSEPASGNIDPSERDLLFGKRYNDRFFTGRMDEIRVSNIARSNGWVRTEYNNQNNQSGFWSVGSEWSEGVDAFDGDGVISSPMNLDRITEVESSRIYWSTTDANDEGINIGVAVSESWSDVPEFWQEAENDGRIPLISVRDDLSGKFLWIRKEVVSPGVELSSLNASVSGYDTVCETDLQWTFDDVELVTGMTKNRIIVTAFDQWDSTGSDRIIIKSTLPPVKPLPPDFDLRAVCSTDSADLDHVRIEIEGKEQDVRYYDSYEIEKNSVSLGLTSADDNGNLLYIDTGVDAGIEYEYRVRAVNTEWDSDSHIYSNWTDPAIAQKDCLPTITGFTAQARCSRYGEPYVRGCVDDQGGDIVTSTNLLRVFRLLPSYLFIEEDHTKHLCQWTDPPGVQSNGIYIGPGDGLSAGNYTYRAQGCLGSGTDEVCVDFPEDRTVSFATNACVPPDSVMERFGPLMCTFEGGNPTVSYDINVGYIAEALRNFTKYLVYQCNDSVCGNRTLVGVCDREEEVSSQYCTTVHHLRSILPATYRYAVRTYNEAYETDSYEDEYALGPLSDVEEIYVEDICDYDWEGSERVNISANLECRYDDSYFEGTASENDFRRIVVSVDDPDNPDTSSVYKVYKCTSEDFVTCAPLDQCSLSGAGQCAVDEGPDDNTTHYYMVEMCDWEGKNCSSPRSASEYVEGDACVPTVPQIDKEEIEHSGCVAPDAEYQRIKLRAFSYDRQNTSIYIKTFRDGGSGNNLAQGQWGFDDNARIGETYTYGFQACNELLEPGFDCGDVHEVEYKVTANVCPPKTPERLEMTDVDCNEDGYLSGVTLLAGDSDYHDGFEIERSDPVSPTFSCSYESDYYNAESCTDVFDPPISSAVNYYYRARSYRDTLKSDWTDELAASLDPYVLCGAPFELKREKSYIIITVTDSDIGGGTVTSDYEVVDIEPRGGFTGTVYFSVEDIHIELTDVMKAFITEEDVSFNLVNTEVDYPYEGDSRFRFNVTIPDYDYLQGEEEVIGAYITVIGRSEEGFFTSVTYELEISLEGGQTQ